MERQEITLELVKGMLNSTGKIRLPVTGTSMEPALFTGDILVICKQHPVQLGDLVLAELPDNGMKIHRLVKKLKTGDLILAGDHLWGYDDVIRQEQVLGIVIGVERGTREVKITRIRPLLAYRTRRVRHLLHRLIRKIAG